MAPYTGKVTVEPGYIYAPYVPVYKNKVLNARGTPVVETKKKFAFRPKITSGGQKIWFKRYVRVQTLQHGPIEFPPLVEEEWIFTPKEYVWWLLQQD